MSDLEVNLENRDWLKKKIYAEIVGPDTFPQKDSAVLDFSENIVISKEDLYKPKVQSNGEEVLWQDSPIKRYGAGILYPQELTENRILASEEGENSYEIKMSEPDDVKEVRNEQGKKRKQREPSTVQADDSEDYDVTLSNSHKPSAMGLSFMVSIEKLSAINITLNFATYLRKKSLVRDSKGEDREYKPTFWFRKPYKEAGQSDYVITISKNELINAKDPIYKYPEGYENRLKIIALVRGYEEDKYLITLTMLNIQKKIAEDTSLDELCFFQSGFSVSVQSDELSIIPYPEIHQLRDFDSEEEINRLLYRGKKIFAVGHGCAASWSDGAVHGVSKLSTEVLPEYETASVSADLSDADGNSLKVSMRKLAGLDNNDDGRDELDKLVNAYQTWIESLRDLESRETPNGEPLPVPKMQYKTAKLLIQRCEKCLTRIKHGIDYIFNSENETALKAFRLANKSMLLSQLRQSSEIRNPKFSPDGKISWDKPILNPDPSVPHESKGYWRPFQIAFLLMTLRGIADPDNASERDIVDLIWFPTGGGKTEAYLGLTAFTIFFNRLKGESVNGSDVIMRYTLRLLTAQQFQRASTLFCAMEYIRRNSGDVSLGEKEFSIGMWVGGEATPNDRKRAIQSRKELIERPTRAENPFVLLKCPWCNAKMGPYYDGKKSRVIGYHAGYHDKRSDNKQKTVLYRCEDNSCDFGFIPTSNNCLPIKVIDEDLINSPPNLIIGTVDKFAMLTWDPKFRSLFGIDNNGDHDGLPPSLIIQDELHLISGPLGSMVGAYETVIEELCTLYDDGRVIKPKIIASTATISRAREQVNALYARDKMMLFPPSGLEASDSFFSKESRDDSNNLKPGRLYLGVMAPGHGSLQTTQARVYAKLLHSAAQIDSGEIKNNDPWWTLLIFFNSLRELGGASTLFSSDVKDYLQVIRNRYNERVSRFINTLIELNSRMRSDEIPQYIEDLEKTLKKNKKGSFVDAVDVCLASSIIEVGVDIDRLSLMAIVGQPKTTSQYIQVSSRVGRNLRSPGLVLTLFSQGKPRDRSHYEKFMSYHQSLYAQVEPTSVTPFSPPAVDRALHAIIVAITRQLSPISSVETDARPFPLSLDTPLRKKIERLIDRRVEAVDDSEQTYVKEKFQARLKQWEVWNPSKYGGWGTYEDAPLMYPAGSYERKEWSGHSWPTMSSMRSVDASCEAEITNFYNEVIED